MRQQPIDQKSSSESSTFSDNASFFSTDSFGSSSVLDSLYPDLSRLVGRSISQRTWSSCGSWERLEMPGEEESRIWGAPEPETNNDRVTEPVHPMTPSHQEPVGHGDEYSPTEVDSVEAEESYLSDSEEFDEFDGGVSLDGNITDKVQVAELLGAEAAASEPSKPYTDPPPAVPAPIFEESDGEDYGYDDDLEEKLKGLYIAPHWTYTLRELPPWAQYEATRIALHCRVPLSNTKVSEALSPYLDELKVACKAKDHQQSWHKVMEEFASQYSTKLPQQRMAARLWAVSQSQEEGWSRTAYMTGNIVFNSSSSSESPFSIKLNALSYQSESRFWRKFGSHRFLTLRVPSAPKDNRPMSFERKQLCKSPEIFHQALVNFLMEGIELLGRIWKLFYVRDSKDKNNKTEPFQAILFAVRGERIAPEDECEVEELINWHIPLVPRNLGQTVPKLWSRISLGLTKTQPTVCFTTDQICPDSRNPRKPGDTYTPDPDVRNRIGNKKGEIMDDGCSIASPAVFRRIREILGLKEAPTAVQGRLAGAKGLWIVDPIALKEVAEGKRDKDQLWIRVNESQVKYQPHKGPELDPAWTTLDVAWCSHPPKPADVNLQLLAILDHRGVPFGPLRDLVDEHLEAIIKKLEDAMGDPVLLRNWVYANGKLSNARAIAPVVFEGGCPAAPAERLVMWLDAGFRPQEQAHVMEDLIKMVEGFWKSLREKMHITIPLSTNLFCVADPTGTLKEGEVSLHFSKGIEDPRIGRSRDFVEGDILVGRNPAQLPSDIQKVRAVYNEHLRELKDVIVFSRQGERSLASLLSGGDYDGDKCWICWDPRIVGPFQKDGPVYTAFEQESEWFDRYNERVDKLPVPELPTLSNLKISDEQRAAANAFLRAGALYTLNSETSMLGKYAKVHDRYAKQFGLADDLAIELAKVCAELVDAPKQGKSLKQGHKLLLQRKFAQKGYRDVPGYNPPPADPNDKTAGIIARLDGFAQIKIAQRKALFDTKLKASEYSDSDLTWMIHAEDERARKDAEIKSCLRHLRSELQRVWSKWNATGNGYQKHGYSGLAFSQSSQSSQSLSDEDSFRSKVEACHAEFILIKPLPEGQTTTHPVITRWLADADKPSSEWQLLKASAAFLKWGGVYAISWYLAGQQLCELKARARGSPRFVIEDIYQSLKSDGRFMRRREEDMIIDASEEGEEDGEEVWYDFEEDFD